MNAHLWKIAFVVAMTHGFRAMGRRVGPRWSSLALGLPCSTAVALVGSGCDRGVEFASSMAETSLLGLSGAVTLPLAVAWAIGRGWRLPLAAVLGIAAYLAVAISSRLLLPPGAGGGLVLALSSVLLTTRLMEQVAVPRGRRSRAMPASCSRLLALRTLVPVGCLLAVITLGKLTGPTGAGLMSTFPGVTLTVLILTYLEGGPLEASRMARALPAGNLGTIAFIAAFRLAGPGLGLAGATFVGYLAALGALGLVASQGRIREWAGRWEPVETPLRAPAWPRSGRTFQPFVERIAA
jgi:hypothetical protein